MDHTIQLLQSAMKAKAPIVAINREGLTPICLKRSLLVNSLKGVKITSVKVIGEGWLQVLGHAGSVKCSRKFRPMECKVALRDLSKWSDREQRKRNKKILEGALAKDWKRVAKLAEFEKEGELSG